MSQSHSPMENTEEHPMHPSISSAFINIPHYMNENPSSHSNSSYVHSLSQVNYPMSPTGAAMKVTEFQQQPPSLSDDIEIFYGDDCFLAQRKSLTYRLIATTVGLKEKDILKLTYTNVSNKNKYTVLLSDPRGIEMIMQKGDKVCVIKKNVAKRKSRPCEATGKSLKKISKDRFTKFDYIEYLEEPSHVTSLESMRSKVVILFGSERAESLILNRIAFICPFKHCKKIGENDLGGNVAGFIRHLLNNHGDSLTGRVLTNRWSAMKNMETLESFDLENNGDLEMPLKTHRLYCDVSIIKDMLETGDLGEAKKILDERVKNVVATDWNYRLVKL